MSSLTRFEKQLEPGAITSNDPLGLSAVISAKRSADALEKIADHLSTLAGELAHPEWGVAPAIREVARSR